MTERTDRTARWTPLWLLLAMTATAIYASSLTVGNVGMSDAAPFFSRYSVDWMLPVLLQAFGLVAAGLVVSAVACGGGATWAGARYLAGRARESEYPRAARALGVAGSFALHAGVVLGFVGLLVFLDALLSSRGSSGSGGSPRIALDEWHATMRRVDRARHMILFAAPLGVLAGRLFLGAPAESAALCAGVDPPRFSRSAQVLALAIVPVFLVLALVKYPTISGH